MWFWMNQDPAVEVQSLPKGFADIFKYIFVNKIEFCSNFAEYVPSIHIVNNGLDPNWRQAIISNNAGLVC